MNERIVKLFMQSVDTNYIPLPIEDHIPLWTEKFAELIVQECTDCADFVGQVNIASGYPNSTAHHVKQKIKQHFGVEE